MPRVDFIVSSAIRRSPRVRQIEGIYDVEETADSTIRWSAELPVEDRPWSIGLIVGPSGSGKTQVLKRLWPNEASRVYDWPEHAAVIDGFPQSLGIKTIVELMSSVGFGTVPAWLRPFHVLSLGEQFRVTMARALAEHDDLIVLDEFTSVVDRTVAKVGSYAVQKSVRRRGNRLIAATCHEDVQDWLQPDWVFRPDLCRFQWRELQQRPSIPLIVTRSHYSAWDVFRYTHYLNTSLNRSAKCFVSWWGEVPVAFLAVLSNPHSKKGASFFRYHRLVCLPDYQGLGLGVHLADFIASLYLWTDKKIRRTASHPAVNAHCFRSKHWRCIRSPSLAPKPGVSSSYSQSAATQRLTSSFEYCGPRGDRYEAQALGIV